MGGGGVLLHSDSMLKDNNLLETLSKDQTRSILSYVCLLATLTDFLRKSNELLQGT